MKISLRYKAYNEIKNRIIYFDFKPGQKIIESEVATDLDMSRTPIREALLMLESEKLVNCNGKAGFYVRRLSPQNTTHYFKLRIMIEQFAAESIFENITPSEKKSLEANIKAAQKANEQKNMKEFIQYETQFHQILYESSRSEVLIETLVPLSDKFHWLRAISLHAPGGSDESLAQHKKIYESIKKNNINEYKKLMQLHFESSENKYKIMQDLFL